MRLHPVATLLAVAVLSACATATPTATPGVDRLSPTVLRYRGPAIEVDLGYRFAGAELGDDWLMVDVAVTGVRTGETVEIPRESIRLRLPDGSDVALASERRFAQAYDALRPKIAQATVAADPLDFHPDRMPCSLSFFAPPAGGVVELSAWVDATSLCTGRLFFAMPGPVQPGPYALEIDLRETRVRIPFELGARR